MTKEDILRKIKNKVIQYSFICRQKNVDTILVTSYEIYPASINLYIYKTDWTHADKIIADELYRMYKEKSITFKKDSIVYNNSFKRNYRRKYY